MIWHYGIMAVDTWHNDLFLTTASNVNCWADFANHVTRLQQVGDAENFAGSQDSYLPTAAQPLDKNSCWVIARVNLCVACILTLWNATFMAKCKTAVTPVIMHWSYYSLALSPYRVALSNWYFPYWSWAGQTWDGIQWRVNWTVGLSG